MIEKFITSGNRFSLDYPFVLVVHEVLKMVVEQCPTHWQCHAISYICASMNSCKSSVQSHIFISCGCYKIISTISLVFPRSWHFLQTRSSHFIIYSIDGVDDLFLVASAKVGGDGGQGDVLGFFIILLFICEN